MSAAPSQNAITRALNSAVMAAVARGVILALPVVTTVGLYAGHRYFVEKVESAPALVQLRSAHEKALEDIHAQDLRIRELEESSRAAASAIDDVVDRLKRLDRKADASSQQINRLIGAFEARGIVPRQPDTLDP